MKELLDEEIKRIAIAYNEATDEIDQIPEWDREDLRRTVSRMFAEMDQNTYFDFTKEDPYEYNVIEPMLRDYKERSTIRVNTSGNESTLWGVFYNLMFRAVHDYIHTVFELDFNYADEKKAYEQQLRWSISKDHIGINSNLLSTYAAVLRSEIIYQAAYKTYYGEFHVPTQKIILREL